MSYQFRGFYVPDRMLSHMLAYAERGEPVGNFLSAIIDNDLLEAVGRADDENIANLPAFVGWFYNECPSDAFGSREKRLAWIEKFQQAAEARANAAESNAAV